MQAVCAVEFIVLQRVNDVEANEPEDNGPGQNQGKEGAFLQQEPSVFDGEKIKAALDRQPGADGGQRQGEAEINVSEIREAFGQRIKANQEKRHGRKIETSPVDEVTGDNQPQAAQQAKRAGSAQRDSPAGQIAVHRARIGLVEVAVYDPVEGHGASAGADHRRQDQTERAPAGPAAPIACGDHHGGEGERQGEDGVGKFDETGVSCEAG